MGLVAKNIGLVLLFVAVGGVGAYFTNYAGLKDWADIMLFSRPPHWQEPNIDDPNDTFGEPEPEPR